MHLCVLDEIWADVTFLTILPSPHQHLGHMHQIGQGVVPGVNAFAPLAQGSARAMVADIFLGLGQSTALFIAGASTGALHAATCVSAPCQYAPQMLAEPQKAIRNNPNMKINIFCKAKKELYSKHIMNIMFAGLSILKKSVFP